MLFRSTLGFNASPLVVGVGVLVGARVGLSILLGAVLAWVVIAPALVARGVAGPSYPELVTWTLWPGAALMVAGSLTMLVFDAGKMIRAWRTAPAAGEASAAWVKPALMAAAAAVIAIGWLGFDVHPLHALLAIALATAFSLAGMQATGETDNTPSGPLGGLTQVVVGGLPPGGVGAPLHAGGVVNGAVTHSSQMIAAWKTGEVVGSAPRRLLLAQLAGVASGAVAAAIAFWLIDRAYGIGTESMPSPAAMSWKATADAVAGGTDSMPAGAPLWRQETRRSPALPDRGQPLQLPSYSTPEWKTLIHGPSSHPTMPRWVSRLRKAHDAACPLSFDFELPAFADGDVRQGF